MEKYEIILKQKKDVYTSGWEISSFVNRFSTYYYKLDLLFNLKQLIESGIEAKNIIILHESFKINMKYNYLDEVELDDKNLNRIFNIGIPVSLEINERILKQKYAHLFNERIREKKQIKEAKIHIKREFGFNFFNELDELHIIEILDKLNNLYRKENKNFLPENIEKIIEIEKEKIIKDYHEELKKSSDEKKTYQEFFRIFKKLLRPVIGVVDLEKNKISFKSIEHINKSRINEKALRFESLSHNSPLQLLLGGGVQLINAGMAVYKTKKEVEYINEQINTEKEKQKTEILSQELKRIEILEKMNKMNKSENVEMKMKEGINKYLRNEYDKAYTQVNKGLKNIADSSGYELKDIIKIDIKG